MSAVMWHVVSLLLVAVASFAIGCVLMAVVVASGRKDEMRDAFYGKEDEQ
jgi:hypothetical protein